MLALLNPQGRTLWRREKQTLWGLCFASEYRQSNPLDPQLLFAGQYFDEESGLAYNRFRYYYPESGGYISSDPIGLQGGETPYRYIKNPLDWVDLFGLAGCKPRNLSPKGSGGRGAFNEAKRRSGIPTSQQPSKVLPNIDKRGNQQSGKIYEFDIPKPGGGKRIIQIRDDSRGHVYPDDPIQNRVPHFNGMWGNHYDY